MQIKYSIIVPIYNIEKFLVKCIESLISQTYKCYEIILVNDGSTDSCTDICERYRVMDDRITVINKKNNGLVSARQSGVDIAKGEYIAIVDGDDWIENDYLEKIDQIALRYSPDIISFSYIQVCDQTYIKQQLPIREGFYNREMIEKEIFPHLICDKKRKNITRGLWTNVYKKCIYSVEQKLVDPRIIMGEDLVCDSACKYRANSIYVMDEYLYYYRKNMDSITNVKKTLSLDSPMIFGKQYLKRINSNDYDLQEQINRAVVCRLFSVIITQFYRKEPYYMIANDIKKVLNQEYYKNAIRNARFSLFSSGFIAWVALKYRFIYAIKLYTIALERRRK